MDAGEKRALIIGISEYDKLEPLVFCKIDGLEMVNVLSLLDYKIPEGNVLLGHIKWERMRDSIYDFFSDQNTKPDDLLLFYYSGHGVPDADEDVFLATSEIDPYLPSKRGFNFNELTKMIRDSISTSIVAILDCCYSGSARISKGHEDDVARLGRSTIDRQSGKLAVHGEGKCILAASQAQGEAYVLEEHNHSLFTYYLLEGLKGKDKSAISDTGYITADSLSKYVYNTIMSLPPNKRPKQKPIRKVEASGDILLAYYPHTIGKQENKMPEQTLVNKEKPLLRAKDDLDRDLESKVRSYIQQKKGRFSISQCAIDLDASVSEINDIIGLLRFHAQGR